MTYNDHSKLISLVTMQLTTHFPLIISAKVPGGSIKKNCKYIQNPMLPAYYRADGNSCCLKEGKELEGVYLLCLVFCPADCRLNVSRYEPLCDLCSTLPAGLGLSASVINDGSLGEGRRVAILPLFPAEMWI